MSHSVETISLADARAAHQALKTGTVSSIDAIFGNLCDHDESHLSPEKAESAINSGKPICGYYYKTTHKKMWEALDKSLTSEKYSSPPSKIDGKKVGKSQFQRIDVKFVQRMNQNEVINTIREVISQDAAKLCFKASSKDPHQNFVLIGDLPRIKSEKDFFQVEGTTLIGDIHKCVSQRLPCSMAAIVICASAASNVRIVTHYPITTDDMKSMIDLT